MADIVVTWPKSRGLGSYLSELARAQREGELAYFRVMARPHVDEGDRCFHVHDGKVHGWLRVLGVREMGADAPVDTVTDQRFRPGIYIERDPHWRPLAFPIEMRGFQGFRYWRGGD